MRIRTLRTAVATAAFFSSVMLAAVPAAADTSVPIIADNIAFDTATLTQTAEYPAGAGTAPDRPHRGPNLVRLRRPVGLRAREVDLTAEPATATLDLAGTHDFASTPML
ncbi:hypothetical protein ACIRQQ_38700 [Streptomyces fuscichromogenes]|uniref:hypothetical protein n=1 Tax=Streptomyces fuscichromogenes TaxID=1324013 RepID=UPI00380F2D20